MEKFLNRNWQSIISQCNLDDWKEALASIITYTYDEEQSNLLDTLGSRLEVHNQLLNACICYICSSNLDLLVQCWPKVISQYEQESSSSTLQDLIEKVMILRFNLMNYQQQSKTKQLPNHSMAKLNSKLIEYAKLLADQGCFLNAYTYLKDSNEQSLLLIKDRLYHVLDPQVIQKYKLSKPESPFKPIVSAKSNVQTSVSTNNSTTSQARKLSYPTQQASSAHNYGNLGPNPTANALNTPFMPVNSVNHPMPTAALYGAQQTTIRSATPSMMNNQIKPNVPPPIPTGINATQPQVNSYGGLSQNSNANSASFFTPQATTIAQNQSKL